MRWHPSPNFGPRRDGLRPVLVVLHYTAMDSLDAALERLCAPEYEVSAHYLIGRDGEAVQMVHEEHRAWHAGAGAWGGADDINSRSIGIELDNDGAHVFPDAQMHALEKLLADILERWSIPPQNVIGHSDMAPHRKFDPGPMFDWGRLADKNLSVWPRSDGAVGDFARDAARFGYSHPDGDAVFEAFRTRFRPRHVGPLDDTDRALMADLAARFPVDLLDAGA
ncbi:N-acetylmuramoyl-L-alanine amidase [Nereida sp. MMG025]|uniref:N-acetylmuramoyl-L-alanine amidase n=1 Tax=Nereida sp. MMG025 TaxID=2909981 RepID=UPI001F01C8CD|nr:N-acetylmuramoyl-L-alanine amidase [Nereida sp. MMG025]MCF6443952.1 N-acetylmuramoyl-L-alanine amidase [Nereida sp. MMG025]